MIKRERKNDTQRRNRVENEDAQTQKVAQESVPIEEVKMLRQKMTKMYEAWMNGQAPTP